MALAEMALAGGIGAEISLSAVPTDGELLSDTEILFAESLSRFVIQVKEEKAAALESLLSEANVPFGMIGRTGGDVLTINDQEDKRLFSYPITALEQAWRGHFQPKLNQSLSSSPKISFDSQPSKSNRDIKPFNQLSSSPPILILHANGTNRDREAALACRVAGGEPEIVHVNQLLSGERRLLDFQMLVIPGGFSYGDDLGAGTLWSLDLRERLYGELAQFVAAGRPVLGICNGFQALVKSGLLPGAETADVRRRVTLTDNEMGRFECRWVYLEPNPSSASIFTQGLESLIYCPVAHGEGRLAVADEETIHRLENEGLIALRYVDHEGAATDYPANPNGSVMNIAGLSNPTGNVLGLMPHPEDHIFNWQHPRRHRGEAGMLGLHLFENGINYIK